MTMAVQKILHRRIVALSAAVAAIWLAGLVDIGTAIRVRGYRLLQFESVDTGAQRGSWKSINSVGCSVSHPKPRQMLIASGSALSVEAALRATDHSKGGAGLIVAVPPKITAYTDFEYGASESTGTAAGRNAWGTTEEIEARHSAEANIRKLESALLEAGSRTAIFFIDETDEIKTLLKSIDGGFASSQGIIRDPFPDIVTVSARGLSPTKVNHIEGQNFSGWLLGQVNGTRTTETVAIVASYDAFAASAKLSHGANMGSSGVSALMELARLLSRSYATLGKGRFSVLFLLTTGAASDYLGAEKWLEAVDTRLVNSIELALCLDGLLPPASGEEALAPSLTLHVPKRHKGNAMGALIDIFESSAEDHGIDFNIDIKKVKFGDAQTPWQHEKFSLRKIAAGTLSTSAESSPSFQERSSITDRDFSLSASRRLAHVTGFIADALGQLLYDVRDPHTKLFDGTFLDVSAEHINSWQQMLAETPRFFPFMTTKANKPLYESLLSSFKEDLSHVERQPFPVSPELTDIVNVYFADASTVQINIGRSKSIIFDLTHLCANGVFIAALCFIAMRNDDESKGESKSKLKSS